jgi:hypothetical protein
VPKRHRSAGKQRAGLLRQAEAFVERGWWREMNQADAWASGRSVGFPVTQRGGKTRLCVDMRRVNSSQLAVENLRWRGIRAILEAIALFSQAGTPFHVLQTKRDVSRDIEVERGAAANRAAVNNAGEARCQADCEEPPVFAPGVGGVDAKNFYVQFPLRRPAWRWQHRATREARQQFTNPSFVCSARFLLFSTVIHCTSWW